jgi:hypothetical protein
MSYGIKLNRKHSNAPDTAKGHIWVDKGLSIYVPINHAKRWKSRAAAQRDITEDWEIVAPLKLKE